MHHLRAGVYAAVRNIGYRRMLEELADELFVFADFLQLFMYALLQLFALHEWFSGHAGSLGMTPGKLIGIEVGRVARKEVQGHPL